ncbi:MAG: 3-phosphoshikimate 1-carboxyvinyltransferase [Clostridiaceae bacterium]|nr:3-phosphoshikimate 1-carboxyvinyltransferase [Clostridiaceae bacterium]
MGNFKVYPKKLKGEVKIPPSKSMAHRALICASLGDGISRISNINLSDDIIATINGLRALGAVITEKENYVEVKGINSNDLANMRDFERVIDCNESGSTLRFLVPISLVFEGTTRFVGRGNLGKRPLNTYYDIFDSQGIEYSYKEGELDLIVKGVLNNDEFRVKGNISSQFITGLLFSLPMLNGDSKIVITTELESKGYIDLTLSIMKEFGIEIENRDYEEFIIKGKQKYNSKDYRVEGDYSQGAFYLCADALGANVNVLDLKDDSLQGDKEVIDILSRMGAKITIVNNGLKLSADSLNSTVIDASMCPDIIPVLSVVASLAEGTTNIIKAGRLRIKECDRLHAIVSELSKIGANIEEKEDSIIIHGVKEFKGGCTVWSHRDHRMAMSLAIASTRCIEPIILKDYECVSKSYPNFFIDFKALGGKIIEWSMGE